MINFAQFAKQLNESSLDYSIPHIEDLDVETFIKVLSELRKYEAVQKLDGANLRAGIDEENRFFASREQKGGKRFYKKSDFPGTSAFDGFKAAFEVLKQQEEIIKTVLSPGDTMNLEIIYGSQPNTVFYGKDGLNYIAILELVMGDDPSITPDQGKIDMLISKLDPLGVLHVETIASDTSDGENIVRAPKVTDWRITKSDIVEGFKELNFDKEINGLKAFLKSENEAARKLGKDLTNFEVMKDRSHNLSDERARIEEKISKLYKMPVKTKLLSLVDKQAPSLRGPVADKSGIYKGIEGIIFTDPKTREKFKVVDRDVFTKINQFNYQVRKGIASRTLTANPDKSKESRGGISGEAKIRAVSLFGLGNAKQPNQVTNILSNFKGSNRQETINNIVENLHELNFQAIRKKIQAIYISALDDLEDALLTFKKNADTYSLKLDNGDEIKYTAEIKRRTLMSFAETRRSLIETLGAVRKSSDMWHLIEVFFKQQIDQLHGLKSK